MQKAIETLKSSNPELAEKMEKINSRMNELRDSGVSMEEAHKTLEAEFGKPTDEEMEIVSKAMGRSSSAKRTQSQPQLSSEDVSSYLNSRTSNQAVSEFLSSAA